MEDSSTVDGNPRRRRMLIGAVVAIVILLVVLAIVLSNRTSSDPVQASSPVPSSEPPPEPDPSDTPISSEDLPPIEGDIIFENGTVTCLNGESVVGIWIDSDIDDGEYNATGMVKDLRGDITKTGQHSAKFYFAIGKGYDYYLSVGCGLLPGSETEWDPDGEFVAAKPAKANDKGTRHFICGVSKQLPDGGCRLDKK